MAKMLVGKMLNKDEESCPVIEVNMESAINRGYNIQVIGKSEETLPRLFNEYYKLMGKKNAPNAAERVARLGAAAASNRDTDSTSASSAGRRASPKPSNGVKASPRNRSTS